MVYAVMLEFGFNRTHYGKTVLAACFVNDLATVLALGLMFSPFTMKTLAEDARFRPSKRGGLCGATLDHAAILSPLRQPAI